MQALKKIWIILTDPALISNYLFGAETMTDWKVGSPISFIIKFDAQTFIDKGIVVENIKNHLLEYKYWSGFCGLEDKPENYSLVTYKVQIMENIISQFTWTQRRFVSEESRKNSENGLVSILEQIKVLSER